MNFKKNKIFQKWHLFIFISAAIFSQWINPIQTQAGSAMGYLQQIKILIIYSSGQPTSQWAKAVPKISDRVDAISSPTTRYNNTAYVAERIAFHLKQKVLQVTLMRVDEIKKPSDVLSANVILIGTATHFGYMDWQTKKLFDQTLYPFYIHWPNRLNDKYIGCFTTTSGGGGTRCVKSMKNVLRDYRSKDLPDLVVLSSRSTEDTEDRIIRYTDKLLIYLKKAFD